MTRLALLITAYAAAASAHFQLNYPPAAGFDEDNEPNGPCGGNTLDFSKATDFHVGGDAVALALFHPQAQYLVRVTLDKSGAGGWEEAFPIVQQSGLGALCETAITAPSSYAGQSGLLGVVCDAPDGLLFQCVPVNFVSGTNTTTGPTCKNATATWSFTADPKLSALIGGSSNSSGGTTTSAGGSAPTGSSTTSPSAAASTSKAAAGSLRPGLVDTQAFGGLFAVGLFAAMGAALML